jgi:hypothetical protein
MTFTLGVNVIEFYNCHSSYVKKARMVILLSLTFPIIGLTYLSGAL